MLMTKRGNRKLIFAAAAIALVLLYFAFSSSSVPAPAGESSSSQFSGLNLSGHPIRGAANASVTIVEFSDFQCPYCKLAAPTVSRIMADYAGRVNFRYFSFPLSGHANAPKASEAYECATDQGKGWEMFDLLFEKGSGDGTGLAVADLKGYAAGLKLDTAAFNACLDSGSKAAKVSADAAYGASLGVSATPYFFINGKPLVGAQPYAAFKSAVDLALAG